MISCIRNRTKIKISLSRCDFFSRVKEKNWIWIFTLERTRDHSETNSDNNVFSSQRIQSWLLDHSTILFTMQHLNLVQHAYNVFHEISFNSFGWGDTVRGCRAVYPSCRGALPPIKWVHVIQSRPRLRLRSNGTRRF